MTGGRRVEVFDRGGGLQASIYSIAHSGDNSTAALSSQPRLFAGKIRADTRFGPGFQTLQNGCQMLPDPIDSVETPTGGKRASAFRKILPAISSCRKPETEPASFASSRSARRSTGTVATHKHPIQAAMLAVIVIEAGFMQ